MGSGRAASPSYFLERVVVNFFRMATRLMHASHTAAHVSPTHVPNVPVVSDVFRLLAWFGKIDDACLVAFGARIVAGVASIFKVVF